MHTQELLNLWRHSAGSLSLFLLVVHLVEQLELEHLLDVALIGLLRLSQVQEILQARNLGWLLGAYLVGEKIHQVGLEARILFLIGLLIEHLAAEHLH